MLVYPLQAEAGELLRDPQERAEWHCEAVRVQYSQAELASLRDLLEEVDLREVTVTLDAGHASYATEAALVEQHKAHYMIGIKGNAPATLAQLQALDWSGAQRTSHRWRKAHGRWEWRKLEALGLEALDLEAPDLEAVRLWFRHARQALRVTHRTKTSKRGEVKEEVLYAITSLPCAQAGARRLLTLHRGHWRVENSNHYSRDKTLGEDASRMRTGHAPANNAALNNLALAIVVLRREPGETVPETLTRLTTRRERALEVILSPH